MGEQLRGAICDLRLGGERDTPFPELLEALVAVHRAMAVDCEIELDVGNGVPAGPLGAAGIEMLRILGEALTNARRHARAARVRVRVWSADGRLHAEVSDDGHGFDPVGRLPRAAEHGITGCPSKHVVKVPRSRCVCCSWRITPPCSKPSQRCSSASPTSRLSGKRGRWRRRA